MHNKRFRVRGTHSHAGWTSQGRAGLGLGDLAGEKYWLDALRSAEARSDRQSEGCFEY